MIEAYKEGLKEFKKVNNDIQDAAYNSKKEEKV